METRERSPSKQSKGKAKSILEIIYALQQGDKTYQELSIATGINRYTTALHAHIATLKAVDLIKNVNEGKSKGVYRLNPDKEIVAEAIRHYDEIANFVIDPSKKKKSGKNNYVPVETIFSGKAEHPEVLLRLFHGHYKQYLPESNLLT